MAQTVANLLIKFESDTGNAVRGINRVEASIGGVEQRANSVGSVLGNFGRVAAGAAVAGLATLGAALTATAVDGTQMAMDLESGMSVIASSMQRSREEVEPLKELILGLGMNPNLTVTTLEAAEAIDSLARNGVAMTEIMEGAAEATVLLSNATGGDFAQSADIMTDVMNQFKDSAGSYMDAVDGIAGVTNASKFTIDDYALAIAQAGGVASAVGVEFGDFNTTIAAISPLFGSGSDAGTSFKTMLQTLIPKSDGAAAAMKELGLITADGSNQFFDAQGNLKSMAYIASLLQGALAGLTEEQKNAALSTIFGTDAMRAAVALADSGKVIYTDVALAAKELGVSQEALNGVAKDGITAFEALQVQMGQVDALEAAKTRMDNTKGALEILGGVVETVKIQIGDAFLPVVRQLAEQLTAFVSENSGRIVAFFGSFAAVVAIAASYIPGLVQGIFDLAGWLGSLYTAIQTTVAGWQPFIAAVLAVVQPVIGAVAAFVGWQDILIVLAGIIGGSVAVALAGLVAALAPVVGAVLGAVAAVAVMRNAWENDWGGVRSAVVDAWAAMQPIVTALQDWLATNLPTALTTLQTTWSTAWDALPGAVTAAQETIGAAWQTLTDLFGPSIERIKGALGEIVAGLAPITPKFAELQTAISTMVAAVMPVVQTLGGVIAGVLGVGAVMAINWLAAAFAALPTQIGAVIDQVTATVQLIATTVQGVTATITALFQGDFAGAWAGIQTVVGGVVRYIEQTLGNLGVLVWASFAIITQTVSGTFTDLKSILSGFGVDVDGIIIAAVLAVVQPVIGAVAAFVGWQDILIVLAGIIGGSVAVALAGLVAALAPVVGAVLGAVAAVAVMRNAWENDWGGVRSAVVDAWAAMQPTLTTLRDWLATTVPAGLTVLQGAWETAWPAIASAVGQAWATMQTALDAIGAGLGQLQELLGPSVTRIIESIAGVRDGFGTLGPQVQTAIDALQNLANAMQPIIALFGGAVVAVMVTGINLIGSTFAALPEIVEEALTTVTDLLNGLADIVRSATALVVAVLTGDWAGAWSAAGDLVRSFADTISTVFVDLNEIVETLLGVVRDTIVATFTDLANILRGFGVDVDGAIAKLTALGDWITKLFTGDVALNFAAPAWITTLMDWMWPDFIVVPDWVTTLLVWGWPLFITQPGWVLALVVWKWPSFISQPGWVSDLVDWAWPGLGMPAWLERLFNWSWPSFPKLPSWLGGSDETATTNGTATTGGTGEGKSLLGPVGREPALVGAGGVQIVINANVASQLDIEDLAYRVAAIIQRRRG